MHRIVTLALAIILVWSSAISAGNAPSQVPPHETGRFQSAPAPAAFSCSAVSEIPQSECEALVSLYTSTNGPSWADRSGWLDTNTPCAWAGVWCESGHVTDLELGDNGLSGSIPSALGGLTYLRWIVLYANALTGAIPPELGNLANLEWLDLSSNQLSGTIPAGLGSLAKLNWLDLSANQLSGAIPAELGNLGSLEWLYLSSNQLSGAIPAALGNLANLWLMDLSSNLLTGQIPTVLENLGSLEWLDLSENQLSGAIPSALGNLTYLETLDLSSNQLSGTIPAELGGLAGLWELALASNQLTGVIPPALGNLASLELLDLSGNQLSGAIPSGLGSLSNLWHLDLSANQLTGSIPPVFGNLALLEFLDLSGNQLGGTIPAELGGLAHLWQLDLSINQLVGTVPPELGGLAALWSLKVSTNQLYGRLPDSLTGLDLVAFWFDETGLCEPGDPAFQAWLSSIPDLQRTDVCNPSLIAVRKTTSGVPWLYLYNAPSGFWSPVVSMGSNKTPIPGGDVRWMFGLDHDGDGTSGIAAVKVVGGVPYLYIYSQPTSWEGASSAVAANHLPIPAGTIRFMFSVDHNGDGKEEIGVVKVVGGVPYLYIYSAPSGMWTPVSTVAANHLPIPGGNVLWMFGMDYNGDGKDEIACVKLLSDGARYLYIYSAPSGMWTPVSTVAANFLPIPGGNVQHIFAVDYDGDGKDEIGVIKVVDGSRYLYIYTAPSGMWTPVARVAANYSPIAAGDLLNIFGVKRAP